MNLNDACRNGSFRPVKIIASKCHIKDYQDKFIMYDAIYSAFEGLYLRQQLAIINYISTIMGTKTYDMNDWEKFLEHAFLGGQLEIINYCLGKGASNFNDAFLAACINGSIELVQFIINKGVKDNILRYGLYYACIGGNRNLIDFFINNFKLEKNDWINGLTGAYLNGDKELINFMKSKLVNDLYFYGYQYFMSACKGGHKELIQEIIINMPDIQLYKINLGLHLVCENYNGHKRYNEAALFLISLDANDYFYALYKSYTLQNYYLCNFINKKMERTDKRDSIFKWLLSIKLLKHILPVNNDINTTINYI